MHYGIWAFQPHAGAANRFMQFSISLLPRHESWPPAEQLLWGAAAAVEPAVAPSCRLASNQADLFESSNP